MREASSKLPERWRVVGAVEFRCIGPRPVIASRGQRRRSRCARDFLAHEPGWRDATLMQAAASLDGPIASTEKIRSHFPALQREHAGLPVAYFDGPGGTQVPRQVVAAMSDYLLNHNANTYWEYPSSNETDAIISSA